MRSLRPLAAALSALVLALAGGVAAAAGAPWEEPLAPAPPPAMYCRAAPDGDWPQVGPETLPDLTPFQDYRSGLAIPLGQTAAGVRIGDVEYEWNSAHDELKARDVPAAAASGLSVLYPQVRDHGTAVLGILGATDDGRGITGLAPSAKLLPVSPIIQPLLDYRPATAIADAAKLLRPGDVLLIEQQAQVSPGVYGPIEYFDTASNPVRTEIAKAVEAGIVVVEPAGNGDLDIGTLGRSWLTDPSDAKASGALMVGAGGAGIGESDVPDRQRVPGSNWGARVDVQGFGTGLVSSGYGDISASGAGADRAYTACFDGTSGASATVAGAVASLQAGAIARRGTPLAPAEVRALLQSTGLPQLAPLGTDPASENIGPRPQVTAALAAVSAGPPPSSPDAGGTVTKPLDTTGPATLQPAPPAGRSAAARIAAASGLTVRLDRARHRLTVTLRGVAGSADVRVGTRRVTLRNGTLVLRGVLPGRIVVRVAAGAGYRAVRFRITVPVNGAARVVKLP